MLVRWLLLPSDQQPPPQFKHTISILPVNWLPTNRVVKQIFRPENFGLMQDFKTSQTKWAAEFSWYMKDRRTPLYQEDDSPPLLSSKGLHLWRVPLPCVWCTCEGDTARVCVFAKRTKTLCTHRIQYLKDRPAVFVGGFKWVFCQSAKCHPELPLHWLKFAFSHKAPGHPALLWPSY